MRARELLRRSLRLGERALAILGALFLVYHLGFDVSRMSSPSMAPSLQGTDEANGDWILTERLTWLFRDPRRWEVATFRQNGMQVMKRVVGLPGERVSIVDHRVRINGTAASLPPGLEAIEYYAYGLTRSDAEVACADGWFVLGDQSGDSEDSRFEGPIHAGQIMGRAWLIFWPPERIGFVNP